MTLSFEKEALPAGWREFMKPKQSGPRGSIRRHMIAGIVVVVLLADNVGG